MPNLIPVAPNATASKRGLVELATAAEIRAASDQERAVTPLEMASALGLTSYVESSLYSVSTSAAINFAHGLGRKPKLVKFLLKCTTSEHGFSIGDEIEIHPGHQFALTGTSGFSAITNSSNVVVRWGNSGGGAITYIHATSGAMVVLNNTSWQLRMVAFG